MRLVYNHAMRTYFDLVSANSLQLLAHIRRGKEPICGQTLCPKLLSQFVISRFESASKALGDRHRSDQFEQCSWHLLIASFRDRATYPRSSDGACIPVKIWCSGSQIIRLRGIFRAIDIEEKFHATLSRSFSRTVNPYSAVRTRLS